MLISESPSSLHRVGKTGCQVIQAIIPSLSRNVYHLQNEQQFQNSLIIHLFFAHDGRRPAQT
jgi:hypothetical protein